MQSQAVSVTSEVMVKGTILLVQFPQVPSPVESVFVTVTTGGSPHQPTSLTHGHCGHQSHASQL